MERDSIFKDHHFRELQRRDSIHSGLSLTIGVLTLLVSGLASLAKDIPSIEHCYVSLLLGLLIVTAAAAFTTMYCIARCLIGYEYAQFADPRQLWENKKAWRQKYGAAEEGSSRFNEEVDELYARAAGQNGDNNRVKSKWVARAHRSLLCVLTGFMLLGSIQLIVSFGETKELRQEIPLRTGAVMNQKSDPPNPSPAPAQPAQPVQQQPDPRPLEMVYAADSKLPPPPAEQR